MKPGPDREVYLTTGMPLADNNSSSAGQLYAVRDLLRRHARILFPDDHISIGQNFGDGRVIGLRTYPFADKIQAAAK